MNPDDYVDGMLRALVDFTPQDDFDHFKLLDYLSGIGLSSPESTQVIDYALAAQLMAAACARDGTGNIAVCANTQLLPAGNDRLNPPVHAARGITLQVGDGSQVQFNQGDNSAQAMSVSYNTSSIEAQLIEALEELLAGGLLSGEPKESAEAALEVITTEQQSSSLGRFVLKHAHNLLGPLSAANGAVSLIERILEAAI